MDSDDDNTDIVMEMRLSPELRADAEGSFEFVMSPIRRDDAVDLETPGPQPVASSPR